MSVDPEDPQLPELAQLRQELLSVNANLQAAEALRRRLEIELKTKSSEASRLLRQLAEAHAGTSEVSMLRARVAQQERELAEERSKLAAAAAEAARRRVAEAEARRAERERAAAQAHGTLAFQLGSALIQGFSSRARLLSLPGRLWQLRAEAARRRAKK